MEVHGGFGGWFIGVGIFPGGLGHGRAPPVHLGVIFFPEHPDFACVFGEEVFFGEAEVECEALGSIGDEHDVAGVFVDFAGDEADVFDVADAAYGSG